MGLVNWIKNKMAVFALATSSVEKDVLSQDAGKEVGSTAQIQRHRQGTLADALVRGELTQEVKDLRWRMYKVVDEAEKYKTNVIGYDEDGFPITETQTINKNNGLSKIKVDTYDDYKLELVVNNDSITLGIYLDEIVELNATDIVKDTDSSGNPTATIGQIKGDLLHSSNKSERTIKCVRDFRSKFEIEGYTKKMNVRTISETEKLLEFYVSKYPNEDDRKSNLFLSEIKKAINNPRACDFLDIISVSFTSNNTIGVKDMLEFEYKISKFDKLIEFDGYYVVKFKADVIKNGESLVEKFREPELDEKYKNKERKKDR